MRADWGFQEIIGIRDRGSMSSMLKWWIGRVEEEGPEEFGKKVGWLRDKMDKVLNRTVLPIGNSVQEGVNRNIQDIRRQACGYRNVQNFFRMIFLGQSDPVFRFRYRSDAVRAYSGSGCDGVVHGIRGHQSERTCHRMRNGIPARIPKPC